MCEACEKMTELHNELLAGKELTPAVGVEMGMLMLQQHLVPLQEALADLDGTAREAGDDTDAVWRTAQTLAGLAVAAQGNAYALYKSAQLLRAKQAQNN